jgi:DNA-binding NarL/FixJ family response regulator
MRVVVAEDNSLLRDGIRHVLADYEITVVAVVETVDDLVAAVAQHRPDALVVDVRLPPTFTDEGLRAAIRIRTDYPDTGILVFSQWIETRYARMLLHDSRGGVGYLLKDRIVSTADFVASLRRVADGGTALDPEVVRQLLSPAGSAARLNKLTEREREILALLAEGRSNIAISETLHLAVRSVEKNVTAIFTKLGLAPDSTDHRRVLAVLRYLEAVREPGAI